MSGIEDMFATKAEAINSYQEDIKALRKIITIKNNEVLLLRKALRKIKKELNHYWEEEFEDEDIIPILDNIWEYCCRALIDTKRYELQEKSFDEDEELEEEEVDGL